MDSQLSGQYAGGHHFADLSAGVINIPFYAEHNALNLLEDYNIRQTRKALDEAHALFAAALHIHDEWEKVYIGKMDFRAADELAKETEARLIGDRHTEKKGRAIDRYFWSGYSQRIL